MNMRDTIIELYELLMPRSRAIGTKVGISKEEWKAVAQKNFNIIVGMVIAGQMTTAQLKEIKETLKALSK